MNGQLRESGLLAQRPDESRNEDISLADQNGMTPVAALL